MDKEFIWNDALVAEFAEYYRKKQGVDYTTWGKCILESFKASKIPAKDYEILSYGYIQYNDGKPDEQYINQVKRLSDNQIFMVGDKVEYGSLTISHKELKVNITEIESFCKKEGTIWAYGKNRGFIHPLCSLSKLKQPEILLTTEDGKNIYSNNEIVWRIDNSYDPYKVYASSAYVNRDDYKHFSTEEAAKECIVSNKPCLSVNDVLNECFPGSYHEKNQNEYRSVNIGKLKQLVKSKLNQ